MRITERNSNLHGYLALRVQPDILRSSLTLAQREQSELHGIQYSLLETFAVGWKQAGVRGLLNGNTNGEAPEKQTLQKLDLSSVDDFMEYTFSERHRTDRGAVLLGNVALSVYGMARNGVFSLYDFTARYNNDVYGTDSPMLAGVDVKHPDTSLSNEQKAALDVSLQKDPTGADYLKTPRLWPRELMVAVLSVQPEPIREEMLKQVPLYGRLAGKVLSEKPELAKPHQPQPEVKFHSRRRGYSLDSE